MDIDELKIFRGQDYKISDNITIHQPSLDEICNYGEIKYFQMVHTLTSVGADLKWQLWRIGVDYTEISDFELFYSILIRNYTQEQTSILFGDLDFTKFQLFTNRQNGEVCLVQSLNPDIDINSDEIYIDLNDRNTVIIDAYTYELMVEYLRKIHGLVKNEQMPANESTKQILIEDAQEEYELNKDKEVKSQLLNQISAMVNSEGFKYNHDKVWNMKIYAFLDSVKRISKIKSAEILLQSGYSGYGIDLKKINDKQINWLGELD